MLLRRRSFKVLNNYILKEFVLSFLVAFAIFFSAFLVNELLVIALKIQEKGVPPTVVLLFLLYSLPLVFSYSFPMAAMVGCLMSVGRFSSDNEILAMRSNGIRYIYILKPFIYVAIVLSIFSFILNDYFLPMGTAQRNKLLSKVALTHASVLLEPYAVTENNQDNSVLITGNIKDNNIDNIIVIGSDEDNNRRVIIAEKAFFETNKSVNGVTHLRMKEPFMLSVDRKKRNSYTYTYGDMLSYNIIIKDIITQAQTNTPATLPSGKVKKMVDRERAIYDKKVFDKNYDLEKDSYILSMGYDQLIEDNIFINQFKESSFKSYISDYSSYKKLENSKIYKNQLNRYLTEYHYKFVLPTGCIVLIIFSFPLGLFAKRSGRSVGLGVGVLFSVAYWFMLLGGKIIGLTTELSPVLVIWFPNILILLIGIILYSVRLSK